MPGDTTDECNMCHESWDIVPQAKRVRNSQHGKAGDFLPRCEACNIKANHTKNRRQYDDDDDDDDMEAEGIPKLYGCGELEQALWGLMRTLTWTAFEAQVYDLKVEDETAKECALRIAAIMYDYTGYKFTFQGESVNNRLSQSTVWLTCLQRDNVHQEQKKQYADPSKARDVHRNRRYPCDGKLKISVNNDSQSVRIFFSHLVRHQAYNDPRESEE